MPVGVPTPVPEAVGMVTTRLCFAPVPSYNVEKPEASSLSQNGALGPYASPHGLRSCLSPFLPVFFTSAVFEYCKPQTANAELERIDIASTSSAATERLRRNAWNMETLLLNRNWMVAWTNTKPTRAGWERSDLRRNEYYPRSEGWVVRRK